ncbi:hypothetical protein [Actinophytocola xanthii]|uniref:Polyketide cyclase n=1 Tax=Actinophytocola xanthii TaxID=1912961 RepID=A0A1Q8CGZ0_9PSEU|nr:hypothetical protein [Actinophytocola xanthii]OLF13603.1 hypothetical protein BU204_26535 [Actinophytocola xanthii]
MRTIHVQTELPTNAEQVWRAMRHPVSFTYVIRGLIGIPALAGRTEPFQQDEVVTARLWLFHAVPAWRHRIHLVEVDPRTRTMRSRERGGLITTWNHTLRVESLGERRCRYSDIVEIGAGRITPLVANIALLLYRYRQRRWRRLVRHGLLPAAP